MVNTGFLSRVVESLRIFRWSPSPDAVVVRSIGRPFAFLDSSFQRFRDVKDEDWISLSGRSHAQELHTSRLDVARMQRLLKVFPEALRNYSKAVFRSYRWQVCQLPASVCTGREDHECPLCGAYAVGPQHIWMHCNHPAIRLLGRSVINAGRHGRCFRLRLQLDGYRSLFARTGGSPHRIVTPTLSSSSISGEFGTLKFPPIGVVCTDGQPSRRPFRYCEGLLVQCE